MTLPATEWRDTQGLREFSQRGIANIVDKNGDNLIDTNDNYVVDTGIESRNIPATVWEEQ